jgi:acyl-homoserine lactone acylase PvdQ
MLFCVDKASLTLTETQKEKVAVAKSLFYNWDFRFNKDSSAASLFYAWELQLAHHLHEKKVTSPN